MAPIQPEGRARPHRALCRSLATCHGVPGVDKGGNVCNRGYVPREEIANLKNFVFAEPFREQGMPDSTGKPKDEGVKIEAFIQGIADAIRSEEVTPVIPGRC
jgi:quinohemoprotein ethanol dehydrogenase